MTPIQVGLAFAGVGIVFVLVIGAIIAIGTWLNDRFGDPLGPLFIAVSLAGLILFGVGYIGSNLAAAGTERSPATCPCPTPTPSPGT
jgi:hypothetical protein